MMSHVFWIERQNEMDHYHALLREAEQYRLARQALEGRQMNQAVWCKGLSWLEARLSAWGSQLQEQYGFAVQVSTSAVEHSN